MSAKDRVALVTGAGSGVGRAAARALAEAGFVVALAGRRREALAETEALLPAGRGHVIQADVSDPASVAALFEAIGRECGRLDVLFNNAGINAPGVLLEDLAYEDWARVVAINLTGSFLCAQAAFRMMKAQNPQGGRIINNGSISAYAPRPNSVAYTSTKHAITGLTKSLALDGRKYDIACGQIDIGNAETEMAARMKHGVMQADGRIAAEPLMDVENVGRSVAFMASLPLNANIQFLTVMATKMPYLGRG